MITFCNIVMAKTDKERKSAELIHREDVKNKPSDAEVITAYSHDFDHRFSSALIT